MIVYRVEREDGTGPYHLTDDEAQNELSNAMGAAHQDDAHPTPQEEWLHLSIWGEPMHCGFASRALMAEWFEGWGDRLRKVGHKVSAYLVPDEDVEKGEKQVTFRRGDLVPFARVDVGVFIR